MLQQGCKLSFGRGGQLIDWGTLSIRGDNGCWLEQENAQMLAQMLRCSDAQMLRCSDACLASVELLSAETSGKRILDRKHLTSTKVRGKTVAHLLSFIKH